MPSEFFTSTLSVCMVLTTASSLEEAGRLAQTFVEERLAACVQMLPQMNSVYRWQGKVEQSSEVLMLLKTTRQRLPQLEAKLRELHSYNVPEFLVLDATASIDYVTWMNHSIAPGSES
jgi:periplasmic divalent cation tolerance protein